MDTQSSHDELSKEFFKLSYEIVDLLKADKIKEAAVATNSFIEISKKLRNE